MQTRRSMLFAVMAGPVPAIHGGSRVPHDVDARHKAGHGDNCEFAS
ncbi:hypothetical protein ACVIJ6_000256 [Bradyrhizobium sp. USDA 4369]